MDLQHCIACCGVTVPPQSNAYTARETVRAAIRIARLTLIVTNLDPFAC